jgi:hypothetical protein
MVRGRAWYCHRVPGTHRSHQSQRRIEEGVEALLARGLALAFVISGAIVAVINSATAGTVNGK